MREDITPSWLLNTKQNDHMSLFVDDEIASANFTRVYSCKCGFDEIIAGDVIHKEYSCPRCHNSLFFDVEDIKKDFEAFILDQYYNKRIKLNFKFHTKVALHNNKIEALAIIKIPSDVNFLEKKVIKQDLVILTTPYTPKPLALEPSPLRKIKRELQKLSIQKKLFEPYIDMKLSSLPIGEKQFEFILNHYNLKDFEFMKWTHTNHLTKSKYTIETALLELINDKKFKSVKIALFENYAYQLKKNKTFNPNFIHMATSKFSDVNHIVSLLSLKINFEVFDDEPLLLKFIDFMLSRYTQKQVTHYFIKLESSNHQYILRDTLLTFKRIGELLSNNNTSNVKCSPNAIHRQFLQLSLTIKYKNRPISHFEYSTLQQSHLVTIDGYSVNLPNNNLELYEWANELQNCLSGYEDRIRSHKTTVYGFFMQSNLIFAVEIQSGAIIQAHRKYNHPLEPVQRKILNLWLKESKERVAMAKQVQLTN
jgi:hypothetical protein